MRSAAAAKAEGAYILHVNFINNIVYYIYLFLFIFFTKTLHLYYRNGVTPHTLLRRTDMIIELGLASEATKGQVIGDHLELSPSGAPCPMGLNFSDNAGNIDGCA